MQLDPVLEWRRLTEHYRAMNDGELLKLSGEFADLTETAQQALRAELQSRGIKEPQDPDNAPQPENEWQVTAEPDNDWTIDPDPSVNVLGNFARAPAIVAATSGSTDEDDRPHDYTWLTYLCECENREQARQLCEVLRKAKIDCAFKTDGLVFPQVEVAADQLEVARAIAAQPLPAEIANESKVVVPEYVLPVCPKCGAEDPVLESVDPENTWQCEQCGEQWKESTVSADEESAQSG